MLPGTIPFLLWFYPHTDPISPLFQLIAVTFIGGLALLVFGRIQPLLRHGETSGDDAVARYSICVLATLLAFPAHAELGMTVLVVLAYGDGMATVGGSLAGNRRLPWNRSKTWTGSICFILAAAPLATLAYWGEARPAVPLLTAAACGTTAALLAAVAESWPSRLNDNFRVGLVAAVAVAATHALPVGWS